MPFQASQSWSCERIIRDGAQWAWAGSGILRSLRLLYKYRLVCMEVGEKINRVMRYLTRVKGHTVKPLYKDMLLHADFKDIWRYPNIQGKVGPKWVQK
jgi:hypothetical protein